MLAMPLARVRTKIRYRSIAHTFGIKLSSFVNEPILDPW